MNKENKKINTPAVSGSSIYDVDYWRQRCLLVEKCLEESPCDTDVTSEQIEAWRAYRNFIGTPRG